ncbi:uncharacterized protein LOC131856894 [Cryptomeria japonica]|uniref:uncharacterized protein LOC131856894 n=1 Tax=Cryptomeria japonica TaxID=3369 RepID=UPI0027D9DE34|nr:uncharacterized protein LOC131856894 [Cryptomeria japonica]
MGAAKAGPTSQRGGWADQTPAAGKTLQAAPLWCTQVLRCLAATTVSPRALRVANPFLEGRAARRPPLQAVTTGRGPVSTAAPPAQPPPERRPAPARSPPATTPRAAAAPAPPPAPPAPVLAPDFVADDGYDPLAVDHTPSVKIDFEEKFGYLNQGILTLDPVLEPCIPSPPSTVAFEDTCVATSIVTFDSL